MRPLAALLLALAASCSDPVSPTGSTATAQWSWEAVPQRQARTALRLAFEDTLPPGVTLQRATPIEGTFQGLAIRGRRPQLTWNQGLADVRFNQVVLRLRALSACEVVVRALERGQVIATSDRIPLNSSEESQSLIVPLPGVDRPSRSPDELRVSLPSGWVRVVLEEIALIDTPRIGLLPPLAAPAHTLAGHESRPAVGLCSGATLSRQLDVRGASHLELSHAIPLRVRRGSEALQLEVELETDRDVHQERFPLPVSEQGSPWTLQRIELPPSTGDTVVCRVRLHGPAGAACALVLPRVVREQTGRTVVLVSSDTHRADHLGLSSERRVQSPFLDSLAEGGVFFEDCWASTNLTIPSHCTLMTGLSPRDTGIVDNRTALAQRARTLSDRFREAGFTTLASVSAGHLRKDQSGLAQGFDRYSAPPASQRDSSETIAVLRGWLDEQGSQDVFIWLHVFDTHAPYLPPAELRGRYYPEGRDPKDESLAADYPGIPASWGKGIRDPEWFRAGYKAEVTYLDDQLRQLFEHPRLVEPLIALTADHGENLGFNGSWWNHFGLSPATLAVPLLFHGPGVPAGRRIGEPVRQQDVSRTLLTLAGLETEDAPGADLLANEGQSGARFSISFNHRSAAVQNGRWLLRLNLVEHSIDARTVSRHQVELYDIAEDPSCLQERSGDQPDVTREMRAALVRWLADASTHTLADQAQQLRPEALAQLAALGYATGDAPPTEGAWYDSECECERCEPYR